MFTKKIFSLLGLLFIGNRIDSVFTANTDCDVKDPKTCLSNTYYLVDKTNPSIIKDSGSGRLYYCSGEDTISCEEQTNIGYYVVDKDTVFTCKDNGTGLDCTREKVTLQACDNINSIGRLFMATADSPISICLNYNPDALTNEEKPTTVALNGSNSGNYLVYKNMDPKSNIFGLTENNEQFAIVGITDKMVRLNETYTNGHKYVYADSTNNKVMEKGGKDYPKAGTTSDPDEAKILELLCNGGKCKDSSSVTVISGASDGIVMRKGNVAPAAGTADYDGAEKGTIHMYKCSSGNCEMISGYRKVDSDYYGVTASSGAAKAQQEPPTNGCTTTNIGLVYKSGSAYFICIEKGQAVELKDDNSGYYILGEGTGVGPFAGVANKMIYIDDNANNVYVYSDFVGENSKNYLVEFNGKFGSYKYVEASTSFMKDTSMNGVKPFQQLENLSNVYSEISLDNSEWIDASKSRWAIFNCKSGDDTCVRTYGYLKTGDGKYYKVPHPDAGDTIDSVTPESTACGGAEIYKLKSNGVCLKNSEQKLGKMEAGGLYIMESTKNSIFCEHKSGKSFIVEATDYSLTYKNVFDDEKGAHLFLSNVKASPNDIIGSGGSSNLSNLELYDCDKDGVCNKINGYVRKSDTEFYEFDTGDTPIASALTPDILSSCTGNVGKIIEDGTGKYLCLDAGRKVSVLNSGNGYYVFSANTAGKLANNDNKMVRINNGIIAADPNIGTDGNYIVKEGNQYTAYTQTSNVFTGRTGSSEIFVYEQIDSTNVFREVTALDKATSSEDIKKWALFDCTNANCERVYGYRKIGSNYAIFQYDDVNTLIPATSITTNTCTSTADAGKLLSEDKLCLVPSTTEADQVKGSMTPGNSYLLSLANTSVFSGSVSGKSMIIRATGNSFSVKPMSDINILKIVKSVVTTPIAADYSSAAASIAIYQCSESNVCQGISGYVKNSGSFYGVDVTAGASKVTLSNSCSSNVGNIMKDADEVPYLCLDTNSSVTVATGTGLHYVLGSVADTSKLQSKKLVTITSDYIVVDDSLDDDADTSYLIKYSTNYKALKKASKTFTADTSISGMKTYQKVASGSNVYREITNLSNVPLADIGDLMLFNCKSGSCIPMAGYMLIKDNVVIESDGSICQKSSNVISDNCSEGNGKVKVNESKLQFCLLNTGNPVDLSDEKSYFTNNKNYVVNSDKNIIANPVPDVGYYLIKSNEVLTTDNVDGDNLVSCPGNSLSCTPTPVGSVNNFGYYIDAFNSGKLIQCVSSPQKACKLISTSATNAAPKHYIQAVADTSDNIRVITCTESECVKRGSDAKGYFVNSGGETDQHVISCKGGANDCELLADGGISTCSKVGGVKVSSTNKKVFLCLTTTNTAEEVDSVNQVEIKVGATASNKALTIASANDFPGASAGEYISVKIDSDGTALYQAPAEATALPECATVSAGALCTIKSGGSIPQNKLCIKGNEIYKSGSNTCGAESLTDPSYLIYQCDNANTCVIPTIGSLDGSENLIIYKYQSSTLTQLKGKYYFDGTSDNRLFYCKSDGKCAVVVNEGYYNVDADGNTPATHPLLKVASDMTASAIAKANVIDANTAGQYFVDGTSKSGNNYSKLIKCTTSGEDVTCGSYSIKNNGDVYLNFDASSATKALLQCDGTYYSAVNVDGYGAGNYYHLNGDSKLNLLIKCTSGGCQKDTASADKVYLDRSSTDDGTNFSKLIKCSGDPVVCTSSAAVESDLGYIKNDGQGGKLIYCESGASGITCSDVDAPAAGYLKNNAATPAYLKCTSSTASSCSAYTLKTTTCSNSIIGELSSDGKLCLSESKSGSFATGAYLVDLGSTSKFPSLNGAAGVDNNFGYVLASDYALYLDINQNEVVTVDTDMKISQSSENSYSCKSGICTEGLKIGGSGNELIACPDGEKNSAKSGVSFCVDESDSKIYEVDEDGVCTQTAALAGGVYIFRIEDIKTDVKKFTPGESNKGILNTDVEKLAIYQCNSDSKCKLFEGYIKIDTFTLITSNDDYTVTRDYKKTDVITFEVTTNEEWAADTFYSKETVYYHVSESGITAEGEAFHEDCSQTANIGKLSAEGKICISPENEVDMDSAKYLITTGVSNGNWYLDMNTNYIIKTNVEGITDGINIINLSTIEVVDISQMDGTALDGVKEKLALYDCDSTSKVCRETYGYIKSNEEIGSAKFFKIISGTNAEVTPEASCASGQIGLLYDTSSAKLCNVASGTATFGTKKYFQIADTIVTGNAFIETGAVDIVIEVGTHYMILKTLPAGVHVFEIDNTSMEIKLDSDTVTTPGNLALYSCTETDCSNTKGYAKIGDSFYSIGASKALVNGGNIVESCDGDTFGKVYATATPPKLCLGDGESIDFNVSTDDIAYHIITNASTNVFTGTGDGTTKILIKSVKNKLILDSKTAQNGKTYILKLGEEYKEYTYDGTKFTDDTDLTTTVAEKIVDNVWLDVTEDPSTATDKTKLALFNCAGGTCTPTVGYIKIGEDYYAIGASSSTLLDEEDFVDCTSASEVGGLTSNGEICLDSNADPEQAVKEDTDASYLLAVPSDHSGPFVNLKSKSIILAISDTPKKYLYDTTNDGIQVKTIPNNNEITNFGSGDCTDDTKKSQVRIINCSSGICELITGYVKDAKDSKYYAISTTGDAAVVNDDTVDLTTADHCESKIGLIIKQQAAPGDYYLCLDTNTSVKIEASKNYITGATLESGSKLTAKKMVTFGTNYIAVDESFEDDAKNINYLVKIGDSYYAYKYTYANHEFNSDSTVSGIKTYQTAGSSTTVFIENDDFTADDLSTLLLFSCNNGVCTVGEGYVMVGSSITKCDSTDCNQADANIIDGTCGGVGDVGKVTNNESTGIKLCAPNAGGNAYESIDITDGKSYLLNVLNAAYKKYTTKGTKIILVEATKIGSYLIKENREIVAASFDKIVICSDVGTCTPTDWAGAQAGYYANNEDVSKLISCDGSTNCSLITPPGIGYFKNANGSAYAVCTSTSKCVSYTKDANACGSGAADGAIDSSGALCLDGAIKGTFTTNKYLVNFGESSAFPQTTGKNDGDYILVDATDNSIVVNSDDKTAVCAGTDDLTYTKDKDSNCDNGETEFNSCSNAICTKGNDIKG